MTDHPGAPRFRALPPPATPVPAYRPPPDAIPSLSVPEMDGIRSVHLVGIGGAGMSGIARLLLKRGVAVSGSDLKESRGLVQLRALGARVGLGHRTDHVGDVDAVVRSSAIPPDNPEVEAARRRGIPVWARAQMMAALTRGHRVVAVAGTHGKTTTTSMLAVVLERTGQDPTYLVGGDLNESGSNARSGRGPLFVVEADESDGSFLLLDPEIAVVTNVEADHLDFYADEEEVIAAFAAFAQRASVVIVCADDAGAVRSVAASGTPTLTYGTGSDADVRVTATPGGGPRTRGRVAFPDAVVDLELGIPGSHHLLNGAATLAVARLVGVDVERAAAALRGHAGVRRRFERRGTARGASFVDDYAHHPTEIAATLAAARSVAGARVVAVFQPHRYSRTRAMWRALGESLGAADVVVVTDVYGAGEQPEPGVTGKLVVDGLLEARPGRRTVYLPHRADVASFLAREVRGGDLVLTIGAGDVTMVGDETLALLGAGDADGE